jgi:DNA-directed RNA polymerase subunit N (RpoN/RPB10)
MNPVMEKKSKQMRISEYMSLVASYIEDEYGPDSDFQELTMDEKYAIKRMLMSHFELDNSINNAASDVISYIRENREWMRKNIK